MHRTGGAIAKPFQNLVPESARQHAQPIFEANKNKFETLLNAIIPSHQKAREQITTENNRYFTEQRPEDYIPQQLVPELLTMGLFGMPPGQYAATSGSMHAGGFAGKKAGEALAGLTENEDIKELLPEWAQLAGGLAGVAAKHGIENRFAGRATGKKVAEVERTKFENEKHKRTLEAQSELYDSVAVIQEELAED